MIIQAIAFYMFAAVAVAAGVMVISARNPVHSVLFLILAFFNLIPAFPMDGGRVLRAALSMRKGPLKATEIAAALGKVFAVLMLFAAPFTTPFLLRTAVFIWLAGQAELHAVRQRHLQRQDPLQDMLRRAMGAFAVRDGFVVRASGDDNDPREPKRVRGRVL